MSKENQPDKHCYVCSDTENQHLIDVSWTTNKPEKSNTIYLHHEPDHVALFGERGIGKMVMSQHTLSIGYDGCLVKDCPFNLRIVR